MTVVFPNTLIREYSIPTNAPRALLTRRIRSWGYDNLAQPAPWRNNASVAATCWFK